MTSKTSEGDVELTRQTVILAQQQRHIALWGLTGATVPGNQVDEEMQDEEEAELTGIGITVAHGHDALGSQRSLTGLDKLFETMTGKRAASARKLKQGPESTNSSQHNAPKPLHGPRSNTKAGPATDAGDDSDDSAGRAAMITNGAKPGRKRGRSGAAKSPNQNAAGCSSGEEVGGHESASGKDGRHPTKKRRAGVAGSYLDQVLAEKGSSRKKGKKP